jgi:hypothetical protein
MQEPFPDLMDLQLEALGHTMPTVPGSFLGRRLRTLRWVAFHFRDCLPLTSSTFALFHSSFWPGIHLTRDDGHYPLRMNLSQNTLS